MKGGTALRREDIDVLDDVGQVWLDVVEALEDVVEVRLDDGQPPLDHRKQPWRIGLKLCNPAVMRSLGCNGVAQLQLYCALPMPHDQRKARDAAAMRNAVRRPPARPCG